MHPSVHAYVERLAAQHGRAGRILEVGSYDVNGTVRDCFEQCDYFGIDIRPGPGVDLVADIEDVTLLYGNGALRDRAPFDVVVSTEMLEHTPHPWDAIDNMAAMLRDGGRLIVTTRGPGFGIHDHPSDYYRFTTEAMRVLCHDVGLREIEIEPDPDPQSPGVFATALR